MLKCEQLYKTISDLCLLEDGASEQVEGGQLKLGGTMRPFCVYVIISLACDVKRPCGSGRRETAATCPLGYYFIFILARDWK